MNGALLNDASLFVLVLILPVFLLIAYVTLLMMDKHAGRNDE